MGGMGCGTSLPVSSTTPSTGSGVPQPMPPIPALIDCPPCPIARSGQYSFVDSVPTTGSFRLPLVISTRNRTSPAAVAFTSTVQVTD